jgi:hypothetical protein
LASGAALADESVALGSTGAVERVSQEQDALKNENAATFGSPVTDDRRWFKLRWRLPWLVGSGVGPTPFASGFTQTALIPGGLSLAAEPTQGLSSLVPSMQIGQPHKLANLQLGALSTTIGHGTLVQQYTNSPDGTPRAPGVMLEGNLAGLGGQIMVGNVFDAMSTILAARAYGRPIMWFLAPDATFQPNELDVDPRTEVFGIWVTGVSVVADPEAPSSRGPQQVWAAGWDNEAALLDNQVVKTILYADLNALSGRQKTGGGVHPGLITMLDAAGFRFDGTAEMNFGTDGYVPRYFDRLYEIERTAVVGASKAKIDIDRPASWGWDTKLDAGYMQMITGFLEAKDQIPFDPSRGQHSGTVSAGAAAFIGFLGGSVIASQTGIVDYAHPNFGGAGFVVTAEGRVGVIPNFVQLVGRAWRANVPAGDKAGQFVVVDGVTAGVELNFDAL